LTTPTIEGPPARAFVLARSALSPINWNAKEASMAANAMLVAATGQVDAGRVAELRRIKAIAALVLVGSLVLFVTARVLSHLHPAFGFVAAFAEAATIGGLADWYAVVALFRKPLGLPIPHTAIIPSNQHRIADKLGEFIERHFLEAGPVEAKLREVDFASFFADWLVDRKRSTDLARFVLRLLPEAVNATETSGLTSFVTRRMMGQLQAVDLTPLATGALRAFIEQGRHHAMLDGLLRVIHDSLTQPDTIAAIREKVRDELPSLLKLYRTDAFLVKKIVASATAFLDEVRSDPRHPFRGEFDRMVLSFADQLEREQGHADRIAGLKRDLLARPELGRLAETVWSNAKSFIERSATGESTILQNHLANMFVEAGRALAVDAAMRTEINQGVVVVLRSFIADQKGGVSTFIADQVKAWDMTQLIMLIETNVGKDLQYIRFNGALIGGLAGLTLYTAEVVLRLL
jgi:uncharacterized membrane-anchored protein YjiN (DUF445 family)